jgi:hypothetical protein
MFDDFKTNLLPDMSEIYTIITHAVISLKTFMIKSLLTSLYQSEEIYPSLAKRGKGRFFNNDSFFMISSVSVEI